LFVEERRLAHMSDTNNRSAEEIFDSHLRLRNEERPPRKTFAATTPRTSCS
jgi:hypothetical protein